SQARVRLVWQGAQAVESALEPDDVPRGADVRETAQWDHEGLPTICFKDGWWRAASRAAAAPLATRARPAPAGARSRIPPTLRRMSRRTGRRACRELRGRTARRSRTRARWYPRATAAA